LRAALVASCLRGAFPPVDLRAVCFVLAIVAVVRQYVGRLKKRANITIQGVIE